jgi:hypothetical protein
MFRLPALRLVPECQIASTATRDRDEPCATATLLVRQMASFRLSPSELRDLMRYRRKLVEIQAAGAQPSAESNGDRQHQVGRTCPECPNGRLHK